MLLDESNNRQEDLTGHKVTVVTVLKANVLVKA
jgi:hypothetical protein